MRKLKIHETTVSWAADIIGQWFLREGTNEVTSVVAPAYSLQRVCGPGSRRGTLVVSWDEETILGSAGKMGGVHRQSPGFCKGPHREFSAEDSAHFWGEDSSLGQNPWRAEGNPVFPQHGKWLFPQPSRLSFHRLLPEEWGECVPRVQATPPDWQVKPQKDRLSLSNVAIPQNKGQG